MANGKSLLSDSVCPNLPAIAIVMGCDSLLRAIDGRPTAFQDCSVLLVGRDGSVGERLTDCTFKLSNPRKGTETSCWPWVQEVPK